MFAGGPIEHETTIRVVRLKTEPPRKQRYNKPMQETIIAFTDDEAFCKLLIPTFMPGQEIVLEELLAQNERLETMIMEQLR